MTTKKWHVFYAFEGGLSSINCMRNESLYHAEFDTEDEARLFVEAPSSNLLQKLILKFVIHGERIDPIVRTIEKVHKTLEHQIVWERD